MVFVTIAKSPRAAALKNSLTSGGTLMFKSLARFRTCCSLAALNFSNCGGYWLVCSSSARQAGEAKKALENSKGRRGKIAAMVL